MSRAALLPSDISYIYSSHKPMHIYTHSTRAAIYNLIMATGWMIWTSNTGWDKRFFSSSE
jgi:hypothetical protein